MNGYLLDTNVISEYSRKKSPAERLRKWVDAQNEDILYLSVLTLGEMRKGTTLLALGRKRTELEKWLESELPDRFANRLLPITGKIAERWGAMAAEAQMKGITLAVIDGLLAASLAIIEESNDWAIATPDGRFDGTRRIQKPIVRQVGDPILQSDQFMQRRTSGLLANQLGKA